MIKKIHHKFKQWLTGKPKPTTTLTKIEWAPDWDAKRLQDTIESMAKEAEPEVLAVVELKELWILNNSIDVLGAAGEFVFSLTSRPIDDHIFPYPPAEKDWAHKWGDYHAAQKHLLASLVEAKQNQDFFTIPQTWLPINVHALVSPAKLSLISGFWDRVNDKSILIIDPSVARRLLSEPAAQAEKDRLAQTIADKKMLVAESALAREQLTQELSILKDAQATINNMTSGSK
jgi:hypothetical protein